MQNILNLKSYYGAVGGCENVLVVDERSTAEVLLIAVPDGRDPRILVDTGLLATDNPGVGPLNPAYAGCGLGEGGC